MPEILTESFCERCGTRYTFESAVPRAARLKGFKVLSRGLKNFVLSDDTSMDEAMAAARSETDREATAQQLDAFHKTFNFCMTCRQYTCGNCWNEAEGRCLSCAPHLGHEILPAPFPDLDPHGGLALDAGTNGSNGTSAHEVGNEPATPMAWPTSDLMATAEAEDAADTATAAAGPSSDVEPIDAVARMAALGAIVEPGAEADAHVEAAVEPETVEAAGPASPAPAAPSPTAPGAAAVDAADVEGRAAAAASRTTDMLHRFRPGQNLDDEIEAFEREQAMADAAAAAALAAGAAPRADEVVATDHAAAATEAIAPAEPAEPDQLSAPPATEPAAPPTEPIAASAAPRDDIVEQPTWRIVAPESTDTDEAAAAAPAVPRAPSPEPQWPTQPEWPSQRPASRVPLGGPSATLESLWAESAREVAAPTPATAARPTTGVQPCVSCGLSLSATARFCRRCGTPQS
jgi:hypothetical protein